MDVYRVATAGGRLDATVRVPGSKSIANRALVCAALAEGESEIRGVPAGDDVDAMLVALRHLGVRVGTDATTVTLSGGRGRIRRGSLTLDCRLAGTTSRFLTALAALVPGPITIDGGAELRRRPMAPLHDALRSLGVEVRVLGSDGGLPAVVSGPPRAVIDQLDLSGDVSSQFLSALMLIGPSIPGGLRVRLTSSLVSRPYVALTAAVMEAFGRPGVQIGDRFVTVDPGEYVATKYDVEVDASSASYPLAAAAVCGGRVTVEGLGRGSLQGDAAFCRMLEAMGCRVEQDETSTTVYRDGPLRGISVDMSDMSDLVPTLAVVAAFAETATEISGVGFIRAKESDRIGDLCAGLRRAGITAEERSDGLVVHPGAVEHAVVATHSDHRLAMAFSVLGLGGRGMTIEEPDVVSKSWPDFWESLESWR